MVKCFFLVQKNKMLIKKIIVSIHNNCMSGMKISYGIKGTLYIIQGPLKKLISSVIT